MTNECVGAFTRDVEIKTHPNISVYPLFGIGSRLDGSTDAKRVMFVAGAPRRSRPVLSRKAPTLAKDASRCNAQLADDMF